MSKEMRRKTNIQHPLQWDNFHTKLKKLLEKTTSHTDHDFNPRGYYKEYYYT
jgi:hypothetical protein